MLKLGIESGSQKVLDGMGKGIDLRQVENPQGPRQGGIASYVYLLLGTRKNRRKRRRRRWHSSAATTG